MTQHPRAHPLALAVACLLATPAVRAGAVTDGSLGGAVQSLQGAFVVPQSLGTLRGGNLLHSFARFGIASGESATFTTSTAGVRHIVARVTGAEASTLAGPLRVQGTGGSAPSFWLFNPNGIAVTAGAQFDVPAGLHLSTSAQLRLSDGSSWDLRQAPPGTLSVAAPESFGLLGRPAALTWHGASLQLPAGGALELVGGDIGLQSSTLVVAGAAAKLHAAGTLSLSDGAGVIANALAGQAGPALTLQAAALTIDGSNTGLATLALAGSSGSTGGMAIDVNGPVTLSRGASLLALNGSEQAAAPLHLQAGSLTIDGGGQATVVGSAARGSGRAGDVTVQVQGALRVADGGLLRSESASAGGTGTLSVSAGSIALSGGQLQLPTGIGSSAYAGPAGGIAVRAAGDVDVRSGAGFSSYSVGAADAAPLTLDVGRLNVEGRGADGYGSSVVAMAAGSGRGAALTLRASDSVRVGPQGAVSTTTLDSGAAGTLSVSAPRVEVIGNGADSTTIESLSGGSLAGRGGDVRIDAGQLTVSHGGSIATDSYSSVGRAGDLVITADQVLVDGGGRATALRSLAFGERGDAGAVQVTARQGLTLRAGGSLAVMSLGQGRPGSIAVQAGTLLIDGTGASDTVTGIGGDAIVDGAAGPVSVQAQRIDIREGGKISSGTLSNQDGGSVQVLADSLRIDGGSGLSLTGIMSDSTVGRGNAGSVSVRARQIEMLADGQISSAAIDINGSLDGPARGGQVSVHADTLAMASRSGIYSLAGTAGGAGNVDITVTGALSLTGGAGIVANTGGVGPAGTVTVRSGSLSLSGSDVAANLRSRIGSRATEGSGGQPGTVDITVSGATTLADGAALNVANNARVADAAALRPSRLTLRSGTLAMTDAEITAAATVNANAGALVVSTGGDLKLVRSVVSTSAVDGDGGSVSVTAGGTATLRDARITTSVEGQRNGNGGDISLTAAALVMQSGMVQANTEAPLARGGRITVATGVLLPDGSRVAVGGNRIEDFSPGVPGRNVIQAAAPDGVGGTLAVTLPQLDLAASLVYLITPRIGSTGLQRNLCEADGDSRLVLQGRGGLWPTSAGPVSVQP
jgi:filamentous hemagglutinin family protein